MIFPDRRVVVTGASGFLGTSVVRLLREAQYEVLAISRHDRSTLHGERWMKCDLRNRDQIVPIRAWAGTECVLIHLAASIPQAGQRKENVREAKENTLDPLLNVMEVLAGVYRHFIYASTIDVYGVPSCNLYSEQESLKPFTPYGVAKLAGEVYCDADARSGDKILTTLRFSQIYGPNEPTVRVIPFIREALRTGQPFKLVTSGEELRRFVYVDDAAVAVVAAISEKVSGVFNIAGPETVSMNSLIEQFEVSAKTVLCLERAEHPLTAFDNVPSTEAAECRLNYRASVDLKSGLSLVWGAIK